MMGFVMRVAWGAVVFAAGWYLDGPCVGVLAAWIYTHEQILGSHLRGHTSGRKFG